MPELSDLTALVRSAIDATVESSRRSCYCICDDEQRDEIARAVALAVADA